MKLGQDNIFRSLCQEFFPQRGGVCMGGGGRGHVREGACVVGACMVGGCAWQETCMAGEHVWWGCQLITLLNILCLLVQTPGH